MAERVSAVSLVRLRGALRRRRSRAAMIVALMVLAGAVAVHHDLPIDMHGMAGAACVAVLGTGAVALAVAAMRLFAPAPAPAPRRLRTIPGSVTPRPPAARARAGPIHLRLSVVRC